MTRRRPMRALLAALALLGAAGTSLAAEPPCAKEAVAQAQKLLDKFTKSLDAILDNKEKEIMTV